MNNEIVKFNPLKQEIQQLVENVKNTVISIPGDKTGYELMKDNKKLLKDKRIETAKYLKSEREGFIAAQKYVIAFEKEVIGLIEPVEEELDKAIKEIDEAAARERRKELLPERIEKLATIDIHWKEEDEDIDKLLRMDEKQFAEFFINQKQEYIERKERELNEEKERIENERLEAIRLSELAKQEEINKAAREKELEDARETARLKAIKDAEEAAENAKKQAEIDKANAIKAEQEKAEAARVKAENDKREALLKAEKEKQDIIDENNRKELARLKAEEDKRIAEENRIRQEAEEKAKMESQKKYIAFLKEHGCDENTKGDFMPINKDGKILLYKLVGEYKA